MQPLEYKTIGEERHLTFNSIRRFAFNELSDLGEIEAASHLEKCPRCKSIQQSLLHPSRVRRRNRSYINVPRVWWGVLILLFAVGMITSAYFYLKDTPKNKIQVKDVSPVSNSKPVVDGGVKSEASPVLEALDTLSQISDEPVPDPFTTNKKFDNYIGQSENQATTGVKGIYGKITSNGQPVAGVTVMTPGSNKARVTDASGKYYIQVPVYINSLIFIYQGKQLVKPLNPDSRRLDLQLSTEEMTYPRRQQPEADSVADSLG